MVQLSKEPSKSTALGADTSRPQEPLQELYPGLTFQWIFEHKALAFYAQHSARGLVDAWMNKLIEFAQSWPEGRPLFVLNDFSGKDCAVTPYNQQKNRELLQMFPHMRTITAVVVQQNLTMQLSRLFVRLLPRSKASIYLSFSREDALRWLKEQVNTYENPNPTKM